MGRISIIGVEILFLVITAWLAVFAGSWISTCRSLLGLQFDLLPALMVYAGLTRDVWTVAGLGLLCGLMFDSLSLNPLGVSVFPLFLTGWFANMNQELILRREAYAQFLLGLAASGLCPLAGLLLITIFLGDRVERPSLGWHYVWQWGGCALAGGLAAPLIFRLGEAARHAFVYEEAPENRFRGDREIKRWRF